MWKLDDVGQTVVPVVVCCQRPDGSFSGVFFKLQKRFVPQPHAYRNDGEGTAGIVFINKLQHLYLLFLFDISVTKQTSKMKRKCLLAF